jgi:hypothetical protein
VLNFFLSDTLRRFVAQVVCFLYFSFFSQKKIRVSSHRPQPETRNEKPGTPLDPRT